MTRITCLNPFSVRSTVVHLALLVVGLVACVAAYGEEKANATATPAFNSVRVASSDLERIYWECDYDVTTSGLGLGEGALCGEIGEELKRRKFAGDFSALLRWWQQNKAAEHETVARRRAVGAS